MNPALTLNTTLAIKAKLQVMILGVWGMLFLLVDSLPVVQLAVSVMIGVLVYGSVIWWLQREEVIRVGLTLRAALVRR